MGALQLLPGKGFACGRAGRALKYAGRPHLSRHGCVRVHAESPIIEEVAGPRTTAPVFNRTRWTYHQNTGRYQRHMQSIFRSVTFRNLQGPLSILTLVSCMVVLYRTLVELERVPDFFEGVAFTDVPFQLTSFALSLLLVFRTDASYSRWCAAMDAWGTLRNSSSHIVRKAAAWVPNNSALERLVRWVGAFPVCLMVELRHDQGTASMDTAIREELRAVLRPHEVEQVMAAGPYYHQFCLSVLTALVEAAQMSESREATMLDDLHGLNEAACECEKILRFPIPLTYTRHTSRFMLLYLNALPLALYDSCDWAVVPVTLVIAFLLLGIEDIGVQIEEPFSILPLPDICKDLQITARRALAQRDMVRCLADPDACEFDPEDVTPPRSWIREQEAAFVNGGGESSSNSSNGNGLSIKAAAMVRDALAFKKGAGLVAAVAEVTGGNGNGSSLINGNGNGGTIASGSTTHRHR